MRGLKYQYRYILCQVKRAKNPYYISNISTNIYSIEELCYYLYHNIYLLDETIINEQLLVWMKEELHLRRLYQRLYVLLEEKKNIGEFILPIFKEINYLSHDQFREMNERLKRFEEQPEIVRKKINLIDLGLIALPPVAIITAYGLYDFIILSSAITLYLISAP